MTEPIEIKGGAGEFEAAVVAVVFDHIVIEERERRSGRDKIDNRLPAWVRAINPDRAGFPPYPRS